MNCWKPFKDNLYTFYDGKRLDLLLKDEKHKLALYKDCETF